MGGHMPGPAQTLHRQPLQRPRLLHEQMGPARSHYGAPQGAHYYQGGNGPRMGPNGPIHHPADAHLVPSGNGVHNMVIPNNTYRNGDLYSQNEIGSQLRFRLKINLTFFTFYRLLIHRLKSGLISAKIPAIFKVRPVLLVAVFSA
jgi:hypothetical protein